MYVAKYHFQHCTIPQTQEGLSCSRQIPNPVETFDFSSHHTIARQQKTLSKRNLVIKALLTKAHSNNPFLFLHNVPTWATNH